MFSSIDGGFRFAITNLLTMDLSWFFMFCSITVVDIVIALTITGKKVLRMFKKIKVRR